MSCSVKVYMYLVSSLLLLDKPKLFLKLGFLTSHFKNLGNSQPTLTYDSDVLEMRNPHLFEMGSIQLTFIKSLMSPALLT